MAAGDVPNEEGDELFAVLFVVLIFVLIASVFRCSRERTHFQDNTRYNPVALEEAKLEREVAREKKLIEDLKKLKAKLKVTQTRKQILTSRKNALEEEEEQMVEDGISQYDAKGREVYGDAWDTPVDGNAPLRELLALPEDELRSLRVAAYKQLAEWERRPGAGGGGGGAPPRPVAGHSVIGRSLRDHRPVAGAPFDDARFVAPRRGLEGESKDETRASSRRKSRKSAPPPGAPFQDERFVDAAPGAGGRSRRGTGGVGGGAGAGGAAAEANLQRRELAFTPAAAARRSRPAADAPFHDFRFTENSPTPNVFGQERNISLLPKPNNFKNDQPRKMMGTTSHGCYQQDKNSLGGRGSSSSSTNIINHSHQKQV